MTKDKKLISLGFSVGHDKGAVIVIDDKVQVGIMEERLSRVKRDMPFNTDIPLRSINYCLDSLNLTYDDVDVYSYNTAEMEDVVEPQFEQYLAQPLSKLKFVPHHVAHAYSTFFASGYDEAAVIVADAMGNVHDVNSKAHEYFKEKYGELPKLSKGLRWGEAITLFSFSKGKYEEVLKKWIKYPEPYTFSDEELSVGCMYAQGTMQLTFDEKTSNWQAGKLMGLASYADEKWLASQEYIANIIEDEEGNIVDFYIPGTQVYPEITYKADFKRKSNVAGIYQREQVRLTTMLAKYVKQLTGLNKICCSGGSFLNCNANQAIIKSGLFEECYFTPPADDSGIPLGAAFYGAHYLNKWEPIENNPFMSPYFGKTYSKNDIIKDIQKYLKEVDSEFFEYNHITHYNTREERDRYITEKLLEDKPIGLLQGGSEIGPRALGNRSIIASPSQIWMKDYINHDIKKREWYRPFAPSVLFEEQSNIFDLDVFSPYMLVTANCKEEWKSKIPSVVHIDGTSRYQSVTKDMNESYYNLINTFYKASTIPLVLNTSFNGPGEPIVETPLDAINSYVKNGLPVLVLENTIIEKKDYRIH
jgi:carbamoyltransferase|tara:strand:+ start:235 stop:1995 length:1761 start_codon:yes stop_codon:yes gene_type:complete